MAAMLAGAVGTAEEDTVDFHAVTDDLTSTVRAFGRQCVDGTFETVEHVRFAIHSYFKTFIVFVSAEFTRADAAIAFEYIRYQVFCCAHGVPSFRDDLILFGVGGPRLFDILARRLRLSRCWSGLLRNFRSRPGFEAVTDHMHRL
jgi:hypothetical protein